MEFDNLNLTPPNPVNSPEELVRYLHEAFSYLQTQLNALQDELAITYLAIADLTTLVPDVTQAEAEAGTAVERRFWTPERVKQAIYALGYYKGNILGTVSQVGGVPTGAIIERGSNANGEYVRFADGTQICQGSVSVADVATALGNIFGSPTAPLWTYPAAFAVAPSVYGNDAASTNIWVGTVPHPTTANARAFSYTSIATSRTLDLTAVGRWF